MCTRLLFGTSGAAANADHVAGALLVTMSITAWSDVARPLRYCNLAFGAWLLLAPAILDGYSTVAGAASVVTGVALAALALSMGPVNSRMGAWDKVARFHLRLARRAP